MPLTKPTIHLNGTSRKALFEGYANAGSAIRKALETLSQTAPHGRDYYVQDREGQTSQTLIKAQTEHNARYMKLNDVLQELYELAEHVVDAPGPGKV